MKILEDVVNQTGFLETYVVGGAIRNEIMGIEPKDIDLVVIGNETTVRHLLKKGWEPTGKSFPVFRHRDFPNVELAMGRKEKKTGHGHNGFEWTYASTIEEDLERRDFTMNAMAFSHSSILHPGHYDPFNGRADLNLGIIRHISKAFMDDALRIFRAARFASTLGFRVAKDTIKEMAGGKEELKTLSFERIREEMTKAINSNYPSKFFEVLAEADCLDYWFPELEKMRDIPAGPINHHPEGDCFSHTMFALQTTANKGFNFETRMFTLLHDFGKIQTLKELWPKHKGHEEHTEDAERFCKRFGFSLKDTRRILTHAKFHMKCHSAFEIAHPGKMVSYWRAVKSFQKEHLDSCFSDVNGRGKEENEYKERDYLTYVFNHLNKIRIDPEIDFTRERIANRFNHECKFIMNSYKKEN